jgi:hypothetical protein
MISIGCDYHPGFQQIAFVTSAAHACESPFAKSHCTVTLKLPVRVIPEEVAVTLTV